MVGMMRRGSQRKTTRFDSPRKFNAADDRQQGCKIHLRGMKTLLSDRDQKEVLDRLTRVCPDSQHRWGSMSAHQMICHLSDSFRAALGEKQVSSSSTLFKRTIYKWAALWVPLTWPHGIKTRPEVDQKQGRYSAR